MGKVNIITTYVVLGICIGFLFPIISVLGCIYLLSPDDTSHTLDSLHRDYPLLWIIYSAPWVLGFISYVVGKNVSRVYQIHFDKINLINLQTAHNLTVINNFSTLIQKGNDVDDVVWSVAKNAIAELNYEDCVIYLLDEEKQVLIQRAAHGNKNPEKREILGPIQIKVGDGIVGTVAVTGKGEIVNDTSKDPRYILDDEPRLSEITVPMVHDGKVIGIIDSEHHEKNFFPSDHLTLLYTIASMTATKLVQTKYNEELQKYHLELEDLVAQRTRELSVKAKQIEDQNVDLKKLSLFPEHNPNPVVELDFDYNLIYCNKGAKEHLKDTPLFNPDDRARPKYEALLEQTKKGKKTGAYVVKEGFWINNKHYDMYLYIDNEYQIIRIYLNDVTEIKRIQSELQNALGKVNIQQKELTDSIRYAKQLQEAILPHPKTGKGPKLDTFVYYMPKDIVSGDFYAREDRGDEILLAAADCTGHGVPGAMLSFMCFNALNTASRESKVVNPAKILNRVRELVIETFEKSDHEVNDGMDIALCSINPKKNEVIFSGAYSPLYIVKKLDDNITENDLSNDTHYLQQVKGDKQPISNYLNMHPFTNKTLSVFPGDTLYLFSDGFEDQFGGKKGKKFGKKRFRELLFANYNKPMKDQQKLLNTAFASWKGSLEQVDDILVLGIRL